MSVTTRRRSSARWPAASRRAARGRGSGAGEGPPDRFPLGPSLTDNPHDLEAFRQGLRELGYVEGQNIAIEYRFAEGQPERLPALAAELVRLKVDVIVTAAPGRP